MMKWIFGAGNQRDPGAVQLVSPHSLHFHPRRFQQGSQGLALPLCLCSSAQALTRKQHLKLFSDLLLSLQLHPCHWITQSYWTSERPAEGIQVPPCPSLSATLLSFSLPLTRVGVTFWRPLLYQVPGAVRAAFPSLSLPFRVTRG